MSSNYSSLRIFNNRCGFSKNKVLSVMFLKRLLRDEIFRKSSGLMILLYLSPMIGLLQEIIFIRVFGVGQVMDVFRTNMVFILMGQGLIASQLLHYVVIPQLAVFKEAGRDREGFNFTFYFLAIIFVMISPVIILGLSRPDLLLNALAPGFPADIVQDSSDLMRLATIGFALLTLAGGISAILNFHGIFWGQPLGQILFNMAILTGLLAGGSFAVTRVEQFDVLEASIAIGLLLSMGVMIFVLVRTWRAIGKSSTSMDVGQFLRLSLGLLLPQLIILGSEIWKPICINRALSYMDEGSIAIYNFSFRLLMIGYLPSMALITVLFPHISRIKAGGDFDDLRKKIWEGSFVIFFLSGGMAFMLFVTAPWWIGILGAIAHLQAGAYEDAISLYRVLVFLTPLGALAAFYTNALFACHMRKAVISYSVATMLILVVMVEWLQDYGAEGVAAAYVLASFAGVTMLACYLIWYLRQDKGKKSAVLPSKSSLALADPGNVIDPPL